MGEVDDGRQVAKDMTARAIQGGHAHSIVFARVVYALFEVMCGNPGQAAPHVEALLAVAREHGMKLWIAFGSFLEPWARSNAGDRDDKFVKGMRLGIAALQEQGVFAYAPQLETALAVAEAEIGEIEPALATINRAIAETERTGQRWYEAETYRIRGEILLKRDSANTAPAEEAFLTALAVAQQQKAKSFELRAALALAKLYQCTNRAADAYAVLAPALEGFSPTPEFPEIEQARALLGSLGS
jgi:predicted ATPase